MLVLCDGMVRSASTWTFGVVSELLKLASGQEVYGGFDEDAARFLRSVPATAAHVVLKCHTLDPIGRVLVQIEAAKVVYTSRDLADAAASFMTMFGMNFEHTISVLEASLVLRELHRRQRNALVLAYEEIRHDPLDVIRRIATHLELKASLVTIQHVATETSFRRMEAKVEALGALGDEDRLIRRDGFVYDRDTLLHLHHIRDGRSGYGREALTTQQLSQIDALQERYPFGEGQRQCYRREAPTYGEMDGQ